MLFFRVYPNPHPGPLFSANVVFPACSDLFRSIPTRSEPGRKLVGQRVGANPCAHRFPRPTRAASSFSFPALVPDSTLFSSTTCTLFFLTATPQPLYPQSLPYSFFPNGGCNSSHRFFYLATRLPRAGRGPLATSVLTSLDATLTSHRTSVASKGLTGDLTPLSATLTKNRRVGGTTASRLFFNRVTSWIRAWANEPSARRAPSAPRATSHVRRTWHWVARAGRR